MRIIFGRLCSLAWLLGLYVCMYTKGRCFFTVYRWLELFFALL